MEVNKKQKTPTQGGFSLSVALSLISWNQIITELKGWQDVKQFFRIAMI